MRAVRLGLLLATVAGAAHADPQPYVLVCGPSGCTADDGTAEAAGFVLNRELWASPPTSANPARVYVPDTGQPIVPTPRQVAAQAAIAAAAAQAAIPPILSLALSADKTHVIGNTVAGTLDPGSPQATCLATTGLVTNCKTWSGQVVTDANGAFTFDYTSAGFTSVPRIRLQAMSTATQVYIAAPQMPTVTGDAGTVFAPAMTSTVGVFGALLTLQPKAGAGVVVQLTANGS